MAWIEMGGNCQERGWHRAQARQGCDELQRLLTRRMKGPAGVLEPANGKKAGVQLQTLVKK